MGHLNYGKLEWRIKMKKFLTAIIFSVFMMGSANADPINFNHASPVARCLLLNDAMALFAEAQNVMPGAGGTIYSSCQPNRAFGQRLPEWVTINMRQITSTMKDWEGDEFALFEYVLPGGTSYLIVYNPQDVHKNDINK